MFSSSSTTTVPAGWRYSGVVSSSPLLSAGYTVNNSKTRFLDCLLVWAVAKLIAPHK